MVLLPPKGTMRDWSLFHKIFYEFVKLILPRFMRFFFRLEVNRIHFANRFPEGVPAEGFQRTPTLLIDEDYERYILAYNAGHDITQKWKRRTYIATASRPANNPPETPIITGPTNGKPKVIYNYNFTNCIDPDGDDLTYQVEWGDDDYDEGYIETGEAFTLSHSWSEKGDYIIKAKLIDKYGAEGDWATLEISLKKIKSSQLNLVSHLFSRFKNLFPIQSILFY